MFSIFVFVLQCGSKKCDETKLITYGNTAAAAATTTTKIKK
jgi:hypothetical protein